MSFVRTPVVGITSYRTASMMLAASTLFMGGEALANADKAAATIATETEVAPEPIVVTGTRDRINSLNSRLPDVRDAPQSISIIPRAIIEQQSASTLRDVLRNVSGISMAAGEGGGGPAGDNLTLRGFGARNDIFIDGIRDFASYTRDTFNVEQVEVVKGPASAQTGRGSTGGYINLFSKQPELNSFAGGSVGVGAPQFLRATADLNLGGGDLGLAGTAIRLNALVHNADTPGRDHVNTKRWGVAPSIAVGLGGATRAILSWVRLSQDNVPDYGIPFVPAAHVGLAGFADGPAPVDYDNYYGLLDRDGEKLRSDLVTFAAEHDLSDAVRLSNTTRFGHATRDSIYSSPRFVNNVDNLINPQTQSRDTVDEILLNQSNVFAKFATRGVRHDLVAGFEMSREKSRNQLRAITAGTPTDLFNPDPERPWIGTVVDLPGEVVRARADSIALYVFDTIHFSDSLLASGGLRWEHYKTRFNAAPSQVTPLVGDLRRTDRSVTWRAGLTYKPVRRLSLYAGAGTSVNPSIENLTQTTPTLAVGALDPEKSRTVEVGAKWDGFKGKLLLTGALFRTDKMNARTPGLPGEAPTVLAGRQRVDGVEFGATGLITRTWDIIASYTYLDSEIRESNTPTEVGNRLGNVPVHSGSLWTTYKLPIGLELGGGVRYVGKRFTNVTNTREVDGYVVADLTAGYDFGRDFTLRVNAFNLFDKRFADQVGGGHFIPGPGRSLLATLSIRR